MHAFALKSELSIKVQWEACGSAELTVQPAPSGARSVEDDAGISSTIGDLAEDLISVGTQGAAHVRHSLLHDLSQ